MCDERWAGAEAVLVGVHLTPGARRFETEPELGVVRTRRRARAARRRRS